MSYNCDRSQSTGNCNAGGNNQMYEPYMLGSAQYGCGVNPGQSTSSSGFRTNNGRGTVRDCMMWQDYGTGNAAGVGGYGGGSWNQGTVGGLGGNSGGMNGNGTTTSMGFTYATPKAFLSAAGNGQGQGEGPRSQIPFKLAPSGTNPQSLLQPMDTVTLRVAAPTPTMNANGGHEPYRFTIDPSQIYGQMQQQR